MSKKNLKALFQEVKGSAMETVEVLKESETRTVKGGLRGCICKSTPCYSFSPGGGGILAPRSTFKTP